MAQKRIIISFDVEATGPSPATSSCVMLGCVAVYDNIDPDPTKLDDWVISSKAWCIQEQPNRPPEKRCWNDFWLENKELWKHIQQNAIPPQQAMKEFEEWYRELNKKFIIKFVAKPSSYDLQWLNCLYDEYGPEKKLKLPFSIICLSTIYKMLEMFNVDMNLISKLTHSDALPHTHYADADALGQAYAYLKVTDWMKKNLKQITN